jgi:hypothetical protein
VDVTLDKDTFRLGEDVALHIAIENFDAAVPVSQDPDCSGVQIEVLDAGGQLVSASKSFESFPGCLSHGFTTSYEKGKVVPYELPLPEGWLPHHTGAYTVVVTWLAWELASSVPGMRARHASEVPYAVVKASATFNVVDLDNSPPQ